jgi:hypothetical protein
MPAVYKILLPPSSKYFYESRYHHIPEGEMGIVWLKKMPTVLRLQAKFILKNNYMLFIISCYLNWEVINRLCFAVTSFDLNLCSSLKCNYDIIM